MTSNTQGTLGDVTRSGTKIKNYLNPIAACHTNANNKKKTGITGNTSTIGLKTTYASGKRDNNKVSINKNIYN